MQRPASLSFLSPTSPCTALPPRLLRATLRAKELIFASRRRVLSPPVRHHQPVSLSSTAIADRRASAPTPRSTTSRWRNARPSRSTANYGLLCGAISADRPPVQRSPARVRTRCACAHRLAATGTASKLYSAGGPRGQRRRHWPWSPNVLQLERMAE